ncbi:MAG: Uncharacterised protein [Marine Group II euryarchaeote MED-G33]|nr:MAG: Uncharacterised protein [Marine Group II euryarchaeote MED-G33]
MGDYNPKVMIENYTPVEEGYIRCATVQSEAMLAKLLSEGTYKPSRSDLAPHSMTSGCSACEDENQWCWSDAHTWMYEQCAEKLGVPEMDAGIWLYAHDDEIHNFKEAYNFGLEKEGMVLLIVDIPRDRIVQSDWLLFHRVTVDSPIRSSQSLVVDCDLEENRHLIDEWLYWHNNPELSEEERELRKRQSWQIIFENDRWPEGVYDDSMGNSDASIVQGVAPFITIDDLVDVVFQTEFKTWDFLRQGESLSIYGTLEGLSVLFLTRSGITSKRIGLKSTGAMYGHQKQPTTRKSRNGNVHRKKYFRKKRSATYVKLRSGDNFRSAELIIKRE